MGNLSETDKPSITPYVPRSNPSRSAVIIFAGGAYSFLAMETESVPVAKWLEEKGVAAFVVKYRLPREDKMRDKSNCPLMDGQQAIKWVRANANKYNIVYSGERDQAFR